MRNTGKFLGSIALIGALAALLFYSEQAMDGARRGLELCGRVIIPSLFPFFVLSDMMRQAGLPAALGRRAAPYMSRVFGVSGAGAATFVLGITGGYPLGASVIAGLVRDGEVSREEGERLLCFCNASGPAFIVGAAGGGVFGGAGPGLLLYAAHILASATVGILLARGHKGGAVAKPRLAAPEPRRTGMFPAAVTSSVKAVLTVCGFVVTFTVIVDTLEALGIFSLLAGELALSSNLGLRFSRALLTGLLELGGGIGAMQGLALTPLNLALASFIIGWGGLSVHFQTAAVIDGTGIKTARHTVGRLLCGIISAAYTWFAAILLFS